VFTINTGGVHNAVLFGGAESHQRSNGNGLVLDGQLHTARGPQPVDVAVRGRASAKHHRKYEPFRLGIRSADGAEVPAPLLRDRLLGVHVNVALMRLHRHFVE